MDHLVDSTFDMQSAEVLRKLLAFERNEEFLSQFIFIVPTESFPEFVQDAQFTYHEECVEEENEDEEEEEEEEKYYECNEEFTDLDRLVPTGEELRDWRDILQLEEFEDAPENCQELLEIALGDQRRAPSL